MRKLRHGSGNMVDMFGKVIRSSLVCSNWQESYYWESDKSYDHLLLHCKVARTLRHKVLEDAL